MLPSFLSRGGTSPTPNSRSITLIKVLIVSTLVLCFVSGRTSSLSKGGGGDSDDSQEDVLNCPFECDCKGYTVDCANRALKYIPANIPLEAKRVDLRQNEIMEVEDGYFNGFSQLEELILFQNRLKQIRPGMFKGLKNLKTLLLNANNITKVEKDTFAGIPNLNLLSLYDNNIENIPEGTFDPLTNIQVLHPIETSGVRCESPKRFTHKKISSLDEMHLKCKELAEDPRSSSGEVHTFNLRDHSFNESQPVGAAAALFQAPAGSGLLESGEECPSNCTCSPGGHIIKCGVHETSPKSGSPFDDDDLYLDDRSILPHEVNELSKMSPNLESNKISLLLCQKGRCIPIESLNYECKCKNGFSGPFCEQAPTCRKEIYREYFNEDGCRSKKKLKMAECVGGCGDQCCSSVKTRDRIIKMVCPTGKTYTKTIEVVDKCACDKKCN